MVTPDWMTNEILKVVPDAEVEVSDLHGTGDHFHVRVISRSFEGVMPLHVLSWTWEKSGYSLLPQFLTYYTNRVPGVRFTLVDLDLDAQPPRDGRDAWWDQHDVRVLKWIAKLPEGQSPRVAAEIRNMLWSRLQRDYGDEAEWIAVATGAQSATACGSIHRAAGRGHRRVPRRRCA